MAIIFHSNLLCKQKFRSNCLGGNALVRLKRHKFRNVHCLKVKWRDKESYVCIYEIERRVRPNMAKL